MRDPINHLFYVERLLPVIFQLITHDTFTTDWAVLLPSRDENLCFKSMSCRYRKIFRVDQLVGIDYLLIW